MLLCVGKFFGATEDDKKVWQEFKDGVSNGMNTSILIVAKLLISIQIFKLILINIQVPIMTYVLGPTTPEELPGYEKVDLSTGGEMCENITYLGKNQLNRIMRWFCLTV